MANLTITIEDRLLQKARLRALEQGTSVNALLRDYLERYAGEPEPYRQATEQILQLASSTEASGEGQRWTRDSLYERSKY
ncbi:MAG: hypothetical protein AAF512_20025 [Pseudomonadota bacterium]